MKIAIIPARGGSKRIKRKNIKAFHGKPIIAWSIEAIKKSNIFEDIIVSTDDKEIAKISESCGASVPFMRPSDLSDDFTDTKSVICHAIDWLKENKTKPDFVCCVYPTSPLLIPEDLQRASELVEKFPESFILPVCSYQYPINRALMLNEKGYLRPIKPGYIKERSQDIEEAYHDAGQFYFAKTELWLNKKNILENENIPLIISRLRSQDIDDIEDWILAEKLFEISDINFKV